MVSCTRWSAMLGLSDYTAMRYWCANCRQRLIGEARQSHLSDTDMQIARSRLNEEYPCTDERNTDGQA